MDEKVKLALARLQAEGIVVIHVADGYVIGFSQGKLRELLAITEREGKDQVLLQVKDSSKLN